MDYTVLNYIETISDGEAFRGWTGFNSPGELEKRSGLWITKAGARHFGANGFSYDPARQLHHYEWVAVVDGSLTIEHAGCKTVVSAGMYYFMPDTVRMSCSMSENPLLVWFEFTGPLCASVAQAASECSDRITTGRYRYGQVKTVLQMAYLLQHHPTQYNLSLQAMLWRFVAETAGAAHGGRKGHSPEILRTLDYICREQPIHKISVADLAEISGLSDETFRKRFQQEVGRPPKTYLLHHRIARAKEMISSTNLTIKQVALENGFSDPYYFSRLFKQYENISPQLFRKKIYHENS